MLRRYLVALPHGGEKTLIVTSRKGSAAKPAIRRNLGENGRGKTDPHYLRHGVEGFIGISGLPKNRKYEGNEQKGV